LMKGRRLEPMAGFFFLQDRGVERLFKRSRGGVEIWVGC